MSKPSGGSGGGKQGGSGKQGGGKSGGSGTNSNLPSKTGNPSGRGRGNAPPKTGGKK